MKTNAFEIDADILKTFGGTFWMQKLYTHSAPKEIQRCKMSAGQKLTMQISTSLVMVKNVHHPNFYKVVHVLSAARTYFRILFSLSKVCTAYAHDHPYYCVILFQSKIM